MGASVPEGAPGNAEPDPAVSTPRYRKRCNWCWIGGYAGRSLEPVIIGGIQHETKYGRRAQVRALRCKDRVGCRRRALRTQQRIVDELDRLALAELSRQTVAA